MIRARDLTKGFGKVRALDGCTFDVPAGAVFALLGSNGAGKTTAINILMNIVRPTSGFAEIDVDRGSIGYVAEGRQLPDWMKAREFFAYCRPFYPGWSTEDLDALVRQYSIPLDRRLRDLSRGMRAKAALTAALASRPRLLILDEPFGGLDVVVRDQLIETIAERTPETTVLIASHELTDLETFATHIGYLAEGKIQFVEEMAGLAERFREVEIVLPGGAAPPKHAPDHWLGVKQASSLVRFTDSHFNARECESEVRRQFGEVNEITVRPLPLRSIFKALAERG
jgi:ABC-2 type transport system ATP-binding protein